MNTIATMKFTANEVSNLKFPEFLMTSPIAEGAYNFTDIKLQKQKKDPTKEFVVGKLVNPADGSRFAFTQYDIQHWVNEEGISHIENVNRDVETLAQIEVVKCEQRGDKAEFPLPFYKNWPTYRKKFLKAKKLNESVTELIAKIQEAGPLDDKKDNYFRKVVIKQLWQ